MSTESKTLKRIRTKELKVGMFVHDVGRDWLHRPWWSRGKMLATSDEINHLLEYGISEVTIDLAKGLAPDQMTARAGPPGAKPEAPQKIQELERRKQPRPEKSLDATSLDEEIPRARKAYTQALGLTHQFLNDIRTGKKMDVHQVEENIENLIDSVFRNRDGLLAILKLKQYDEYTFTHSLNVAVLAVSAGRSVGLERSELLQLGVGGIFHDIGKTEIPPEILNKPGRLTDEEFKIMKLHPVRGDEILDSYQEVTPLARQVVRHHHERIDGTGYPDGLAGADIAPYIIISGMADVYDALSSDRVYHKGMLPHEALKVIFSLRDKHFPPVWVDRFIQCLGIYPIGTTVRLNTGEIGVVCGMNHSSLLRPKVRLCLNAQGHQIQPLNKTWDLNHPGRADREIREIVDPHHFNIDPALCFEV